MYFSGGTMIDWKKRTESLSYIFKEESEYLFKDNKVDEVFDCIHSATSHHYIW